VEFLQGDSGRTLLGLVTVVAIFGGPLLVIGWAVWLKYRRKELDAELKRTMIERGMSADDIVRVLEAKTGQTSPSRDDTKTGKSS
jgi:hypothetical protein